MWEFYLSKEIPLPSEVDEPIRFTQNTTYADAKSFWPRQPERVKQYVSEAQGTHDLWGEETPSTIRSATGKLMPFSLTALLQNCGPKRARRMAQFTYGVPLIGNLSQNGLYPVDMEVYRHLQRAVSGPCPQNASLLETNIRDTSTPEFAGARRLNRWNWGGWETPSA